MRPDPYQLCGIFQQNNSWIVVEQNLKNSSWENIYVFHFQNTKITSDIFLC